MGLAHFESAPFFRIEFHDRKNPTDSKHNTSEQSALRHIYI